MYGNAHEYLCKKIQCVVEAHPYQLRNVEIFKLRKQTQRHISLFHKRVQVFNTLTDDRKEKNYNVFR